MKKLITILLSAIVSLSAYAQTEGFYRLKCKQTGRYLAFHNDYVNKESAKRTGDVDLQSLETFSDFNVIVDDPGSIIYLRKTSTGWALEGQGFTTQNKLDLQLTPIDDAYWIWATVKSDGMEFTKYLRDYEKEEGYSYIVTDPNKSPNRDWYFIPLDDNEYLGLNGDVKVGNDYYTTFFATFPFQLGNNMKAYVVNSMTPNYCTLEEIGDKVPQKTPVVIRCAGEAPADNKLTPLTSTVEPVTNNRLSAEIFCYPVITPTGKARRDNPAWNALDFDPLTMRVLGESDGKLCFVTSDILKYVPANMAYLNVTDDAAAVMPTDGSTGIQGVKIQPTTTGAKGRYTLQGVPLPDNVQPRGIYIQDGKKVINK